MKDDQLQMIEGVWVEECGVPESLTSMQNNIVR
jgi:hypothetical protein